MMLWLAGKSRYGTTSATFLAALAALWLAGKSRYGTTLAGNGKPNKCYGLRENLVMVQLEATGDDERRGYGLRGNLVMVQRSLSGGGKRGPSAGV